LSAAAQLVLEPLTAVHIATKNSHPANPAISGKSSITVQFVDGRFVESYYPTIENTFAKVIRYKGQDFATEIIDTAGQVSGYVFMVEKSTSAHCLCDE
jgi:GTPase SAR1 family protein